MITIRDVSKSYGTLQALHSIDLHIQKGNCFGLVGPNGAGKSTLMKMIVGVLESFEGEIEVGGMSIHSSRQSVKQSIGYVPQDICLEETLTARDNLLFFGRLYGLSGRQLHDRIKTVLGLIGLEDREKSIVSTFSGGMKRRLNIGCALLHEPGLVILDEPTVGIDPQSRHSIFQLIHRLKAGGTTIIYSSHYMEEVEQLCDSVGFIDRGRLVEHGTMKDVLARHRHSSLYVEGENITPDMLSGLGDVSPKEAGFMLHSDTPMQTLQRLAGILADRAIVPARLELSQAKLEDIFFKLTGTQLRDQS
ncbi:ABC-2 type transport system ATP-binding protein [Rossellomorea marisflavi]